MAVKINFSQDVCRKIVESASTRSLDHSQPIRQAKRGNVGNPLDVPVWLYNGTGKTILAGSAVHAYSDMSALSLEEAVIAFLSKGIGLFVSNNPSSSSPKVLVTPMMELPPSSSVLCYAASINVGIVRVGYYVDENDNEEEYDSFIKEAESDENGIAFETCSEEDGEYKILAASQKESLEESENEYRFCYVLQKQTRRYGHRIGTTTKKITGPTALDEFIIDGRKVNARCPLLGGNASIEKNKKVVLSFNDEAEEWQIIEAQC